MAANDDILLIIAKEAGNQASPSELLQLQQWLQLDAAHEQEYNELVLILQASTRAFHQQVLFDSEVAWEQFAGKLQPVKTTGLSATAIRRLFSIKRLALAAAVIAALATGWYLWSAQHALQTFTATASNQTLQLPDGSTVTLRKGSSLQYPPSFNKKERQVDLKGEAFFNVQHNDKQPFLVYTSNSFIKVTGTSFLVNAAAAADEVVVVTGRVQVAGKSGSQPPADLVAGKRVLVQNNRLIEAAVTDSNFLAWQTGVLDFKQKPLQQVLEDVSHYYGIPVELAKSLPAHTGSIQITVRFNQQPVEQVLDEIGLITGLQVKKETDKMVLYQK